MSLLIATAWGNSQSLSELPPIPKIPPSIHLREVDLLFPQRPVMEVRKKNAISVKWSGDSENESVTGKQTEDEALLRLINGRIEIQDTETGNLTLIAKVIEYDRLKQRLEAVGEVRIEHSNYKMSCHSIIVEIQASDNDAVTLSGYATDVTFQAPPHWTIKAREVEFTTIPEDTMGYMGRLLGGGKAERTTTLDFKKVTVTQCEVDNPGWVAHTSNLSLKTGAYPKRVGQQGYATLDNLVLKLGYIPVMWLPWLLFPARLDRAPGLLFPSLGFNSNLGAVVNMSYFQPLGQSADLTLSPTWYSKEGIMWGLESRWQPLDTHAGTIDLKYIRPKSTQEARYRINMKEIWDMENGWMVRADVNHASDQLVDAEFGISGTAPLGIPAYDSTLFIGKNFKWAAFSLFCSDQRTYFQQDDPFYHPEFPGSIQKIKIPEAQVRFYPVGFGKYYIDGAARFGRFGYNLDPGEDTPSMKYFWNRGDYHVRLQGRLGQLGPFRADMQAGARFTHYNAVLTDSFFDTGQPGNAEVDPVNPAEHPDFDPFRVNGPATNRLLGSSRLQISMPQIGRSFLNKKMLGYTGDIKHILEPFVAFAFNSKNDKAGVFPRFDEADTRPGVGNTAVGERSIQFGLKQHLFGRQNSETAYADLVRINTSIKYYFDPIILSDGRIKQGWGSFDGNIDVEATEKVRLSFRRTSEHMGSEATDTSVSADLELGRASKLSLAFFTTGFNQLRVRQRGIRTGGEHELWTEKLRLKYTANYDFEGKTFSHSQVALAYRNRCVEYAIRYYHLALPTMSRFAKEDRVDFVLNFTNLGDLFSADIGGMFSRLFK